MADEETIKSLQKKVERAQMWLDDKQKMLEQLRSKFPDADDTVLHNDPDFGEIPISVEWIKADMDKDRVSIQGLRQKIDVLRSS